jgi:hypothetical protein
MYRSIGRSNFTVQVPQVVNSDIHSITTQRYFLVGGTVDDTVQQMSETS